MPEFSSTLPKKRQVKTVTYWSDPEDPVAVYLQFPEQISTAELSVPMDVKVTGEEVVVVTVKSEESMLETALTNMATMTKQMTIGRTTQRQQTVVTIMQQVLDFFSCWMIIGAGAAGAGGGAQAELKD